MTKDIIAILDVGSNSVRERVSDGDKVLFRAMETTQLARGMSQKKILPPESINRTLDGIAALIDKARALGATRFFAFATAAVRNADNGSDFTSAFKTRFGFNLDVIDGEKEAGLGLLGAFAGADGAVIDVGGASTELAVKSAGKIFAASVQIGAVGLTDMFGKDRNAVYACALEYARQFSALPQSREYRAIGGTANTLAFIISGLKEYNREKTDGVKLFSSRLDEIIEVFYSLEADEIAKKFNISPLRADVVPAGSLILKAVMQTLSLNSLVLAENDNLEGYYILEVKNKL